MYLFCRLFDCFFVSVWERKWVKLSMKFVLKWWWYNNFNKLPNVLMESYPYQRCRITPVFKTHNSSPVLVFEMRISKFIQMIFLPFELLVIHLNMKLLIYLMLQRRLYLTICTLAPPIKEQTCHKSRMTSSNCFMYNSLVDVLQFVQLLKHFIFPLERLCRVWTQNRTWWTICDRWTVIERRTRTERKR